MFAGRCPACSPEPETETCPTCEGNGHQYFFENPITRTIVEVTKEEYEKLPDSVKLDDICETCGGEGEMTEDEPMTLQEKRMEYMNDYEDYHEASFSL
jgi:DnaJ-class molecular chaperone